MYLIPKMKNLLILILALFLNQNLISQNNKLYSFENVDQIPLFEGCKPRKKIVKEKKCVKKEIMNFFSKNFNHSIVAELGLWTGIYKMNGKFIIEKNGKISNIRVESETSELKKEMERVLSLMPSFTRPARKNGEYVKIEYLLPFKIAVE